VKAIYQAGKNRSTEGRTFSKASGCAALVAGKSRRVSAVIECAGNHALKFSPSSKALAAACRTCVRPTSKTGACRIGPGALPQIRAKDLGWRHKNLVKNFVSLPPGTVVSCTRKK